MNKIKYLVFDLDDTLLRNNRTISEHTISVFKKAQEAGYKIIFNTSRSLEHSRRYAKLIHPDYGIYGGGCQIVDQNEKELYARIIPAEKTQKLTKILASLSGEISVQARGKFYASDEEYKGQNAIHISFENGLYEDAFKILYESLDFDFCKKFADENNLDWQNYLGSEWNRFAEKGANKWAGIEEFLKLVNGTPEEVAAFGDDSGDMEMIQKSGLGVAMKNAREMVLRVAKNITEHTNDDDGCAHYIEDHLL